MDKINRRKFIKSAGLAGGALSLAGVAGAGYSAGADKDSFTGYGRTAYGEDQFFNRKPFLVDKPTYVQEGEPVRITSIEDIFKRNGELSRLMFSRNGDQPAWKPSDGLDALPGYLRAYYQANPGAFDEFIKAMQKGREQRTNWDKYRDKYFIADAWSNAHSSPIRGRSSFPAEPQGKPEESDFRGVNKKRLKLKSPRHGSELLKKICYSFGASLAGIAKVKKEWVYQGSLRGIGRVDYEVPSHWKYAVVIAVPHEWDSMYANPTYGTSYDAYSKLRFIAGKMEVFIKELGYSARPHVPPTSYDLVMPPLAIDAGMGEQGRNGILITPELGANTRLAAITTDMPLEPDKPIDIGVSKFCKKCRICAEECPGGAISFKDTPGEVIRGYRRWKIDQNKCFTVWNSVATSHARGCRVCLSVCPYSRKNNWIHNFAREADPRDPTGLLASGLLAMQKKFFTYPGGQEYLPPPDGNNRTFGEAPGWLRTEEWFDL
ncbi:MAG TPA: reductive dehalogenase [Bacteroidetes bacterium]|nr:reductive dehalogenase [Bacteroidota bacterium]